MGHGPPNAFYDIFFVVDFIFILDCVFLVKLFHHVVVTSEISGQRSIILVS